MKRIVADSLQQFGIILALELCCTCI